MQKYNGQLIRQFASSVSGNAASGVTVMVRRQSDSALATLYAENSTSGATLVNPITTSSTGHFSFYAADGVYMLTFSDSTPAQIIQLQDVSELQAQFDAAVLNAGYIPSGTFIVGATLTQANQVLSDGSSYWRWDGSFPKTVTAGSAPTPTGVGGWFIVGGSASLDDFSSGLAATNSTVSIAGVEAKNFARRYNNEIFITDYTSLFIFADPTAAMQAAIDAAQNGKLKLTKGTYTIVRSLNVKSNTEIEGDGAATLIQIAADSVDAFTTGVGLAKSNIKIRSLAIDGGGQTTNINTGYKLCRGIYATNIANLVIEDVVVRKMGCVNPATPQDDAAWGGYGIFITARFGTATNIRINRCTVIDIAGGGTQYGDGINVDAHEPFVGASYMDVVISNCYVTRVGRHCYTVGGGAGESIAAGVKIINSYGEKSACDWLDIEEGYDVTVNNCTIVDCGNHQYYYNPVAEFGATYRLLAGIATGNDSRNVTIKNTKMRNCYYGITYGATNGLLIDNVEIVNSTTADVQQGLANGATGFKVLNSRFKTPNKPIFNAYSPSNTGEMEVVNCDFASPFLTYSLKGAVFKGCTFRSGFEFKGSGSDNSKNVIRSCKFMNYAGAGVITSNNQALAENTIEDCDFYGNGSGASNMTAGVLLAFNATRKWQIKNNRFHNLPKGVESKFGNGQHHADIDENMFFNCVDSISLQQSIRDASVSRNKFFGNTGWCIRVYDIDSSTPMPHGPKIRDNMAYEGCVNGLQISLASGGSYDYTMVIGNDMHNCSGTKWSLAAGNANGVVANNIT
jgi:hypothetical protein